MLVYERRQFRDDSHVVEYLATDTRPLDLDRHRTAVPQGGPVHLPQRSRREWPGLEGVEGLRYAHPELFLDDLFRLSFGERVHVVPQAGQRLEIDGGKQVRAGGEQLPELDKGWAQPRQLGDQGLGVRGSGGFTPLLLRIDLGSLVECRQVSGSWTLLGRRSMFEQEAGQRRVTRGMAHPKRRDHLLAIPSRGSQSEENQRL